MGTPRSAAIVSVASTMSLSLSRNNGLPYMSTGQLSGVIRIPDTVENLVVTADLRASRVTCHVDVEAPRDGRATTRVNWLVRQLKNAPDSARVEAFVGTHAGRRPPSCSPWCERTRPAWSGSCAANQPTKQARASVSGSRRTSVPLPGRC